MDFSKLCGLAVAHLGLSSIGFYDMTPLEFHYAIQESRRLREEQIHALYDVARFSLMHHWNMGIKRLRRALKTPNELVEFPWEKENKPNKPQTLDEMKREMKSIFAAFGGKKRKRRIKRRQ